MGDEEVDLSLSGVRVVGEGGTNSVGDHGLEFLFLLNFVSIISN